MTQDIRKGKNESSGEIRTDKIVKVKVDQEPKSQNTTKDIVASYFIDCLYCYFSIA